MTSLSRPGLPRAVKKKLPLFIALLLILTLAGVFFLRSPVLVVTDASFNRLYGSWRLTFALAGNSLLLFRRLIPVPVSEQAGADIIALVVEEAFPSPHAVLFPRRYFEGARLYHAQHPEVPVLVFWGRNPLPQAYIEDGGIVFVRTDIAADLYRAGLSAAVLAGEGEGVVFFTDGTLQNQYREAFDRGLYSQGFAGQPVFLEVFMEHIYDDIGCVVVAGPATRFLEDNLQIPVILFSWLDPALTPRSVKIVFNDSLLAQAARALGALSSGEGEVFVPSRAAVLSDRIEERRTVRKLRGLTRSPARQ
ncbi:MAG: hypothetical protein FWB99_07105 [Treponema sp.]|nr:hypothetical protein [Treponema sp.]